MISRKEELQDWLINVLKLNIQVFEQLAGDASFRRYYRIKASFPAQNIQSFIAMDAPPLHEKIHEFFSINLLLEKKDLRVPKIYNINLEQGYMLLEDFGGLHFFEVLTPENKLTYYQKAIDIIHQIQTPLSLKEKEHIPIFSPAYIRRELALFDEWFLKVHLGLELEETEIKLIDDSYDFLINEIAQHPKALVHRDFHSRNLMILADNNIGVIDFQDAMIGPRAYDLVSLLKDCYIPHSEAFQALGLDYFKAAAPQAFKQEYHICGIQRHLKVLGIFSRLYHRDGKSRYLNDLPLVLDYTLNGLSKIPALASFHDWLNEVVLTAFHQKESI